MRVELQLRNRDYIIPHDILIEPGEYLTGAYPVFEQLFVKYQEAPAKAERVKKSAKISLEHCYKYASMQASACINAMQALDLNSEEIVFLLKAGKTKLPKRLHMDSVDCTQADVMYAHRLKTVAAKQSDIYVRDYWLELNRKEQQQRHQDYLDRLEADAARFRMEGSQQQYQERFAYLL